MDYFSEIYDESMGSSKDDVPKNAHCLMDPYRMNARDVTRRHFRDARLYDQDINEIGWEVQRWFARKKYNEWLRSVRRRDGWRDFRRPIIVYTDDDYDDDTYRFRNTSTRIPSTIQRKNYQPNRRAHNLALSRVRGARPDDEDYRAKMFTTKMGREISKIRSEKGLTQVQLAQKINVDSNMIRNIELGGLITFNPDDPMVRTLARELGLSYIKYQE